MTKVDIFLFFDFRKIVYLIGMSEFAGWFAAQRKKRNWSQKDVADRVGVDSRQVSRWETGESLPPPNRLKTIAHVYGVDPDELIGAVRSESKPPEPTEEAHDSHVEVTFFARQKLRDYAQVAGMSSEAVWISRFVDWLEEMPPLFREYLFQSVREGFEPSYENVVNDSAVEPTHQSEPNSLTKV